MKKHIFFLTIVGTFMFLQSCTTGYVAQRPVEIEVVRPASPSRTHIWVDRDYNWNRGTRTYVVRQGYWSQPRGNRTYVAGRWATKPRGNYWIRGRWR